METEKTSGITVDHTYRRKMEENESLTSYFFRLGCLQL